MQPGTYETRDGRVAVVERVILSLGVFPVRGTVDGVPESWTSGGAWFPFDFDPGFDGSGMDLIRRIG